MVRVKVYGGNVEEIKICLNNKWIIKDQIIGKGAIGYVYEVSKINNDVYNYVIKIYKKHKSSNEDEIAIRAGELGVGPSVYDTGVCTTYNYIIMDKMERQFQVWSCKNIIDVLVLYQELLKNGIIQNDLKSDNIMFDKNGHVRIIDYSHAKYEQYSVDMVKKEMVNGANYLFGTLKFKNLDEQYDCKKEIITWFMSKFGIKPSLN